jgi:hypothetical protein
MSHQWYNGAVKGCNIQQDIVKKHFRLDRRMVFVCDRVKDPQMQHPLYGDVLDASLHSYFLPTPSLLFFFFSP